MSDDVIKEAEECIEELKDALPTAPLISLLTRLVEAVKASRRSGEEMATTALGQTARLSFECGRLIEAQEALEAVWNAPIIEKGQSMTARFPMHVRDFFSNQWRIPSLVKKALEPIKRPE